MSNRFNKFVEVNKKYKTIVKYIKNDSSENIKKKFVVYFIVSLACFVLSFLNLRDGYSVMLISTIILGIATLACCILVKFFKKIFLADLLAAITVGITFSLYALSGANEGFAILWIVVLPPIMTSVSSTIGVGISTYFLLFVFVICYTPISNTLPPVYTKTFIERFPLLCTLDFFITLYLWALTTFAERELAIKTYFDELTGVYNRTFYNAVCNYLERNNMTKEITVVSMDVNGLKKVNDENGHLAGDELIKGAAKIISEVTDKTIAICRIGGDEFVSLAKCGKSEMPALEKRFFELQDRWVGESIDHISISYGIASCADYPNESIEYVYKMADDNMYKNKTNYYVSHRINRRHIQRRVEDRRKKDLFEDNEKTSAEKKTIIKQRTKSSSKKQTKKTSKKSTK